MIDSIINRKKFYLINIINIWIIYSKYIGYIIQWKLYLILYI